MVSRPSTSAAIERFGEATGWLVIAAFSASTGAALVSAGFTNAGLIIGAIGAVGSFITKEKGTS